MRSSKPSRAILRSVVNALNEGPRDLQANEETTVGVGTSAGRDDALLGPSRTTSANGERPNLKRGAFGRLGEQLKRRLP